MLPATIIIPIFISQTLDQYETDAQLIFYTICKIVLNRHIHILIEFASSFFINFLYV